MCQVPLDFDLFVAQKVCSRPSHNGMKSCLKDKSFFFTCVFMIFLRTSTIQLNSAGKAIFLN